jgi:hypothetical protein
VELAVVGRPGDVEPAGEGDVGRGRRVGGRVLDVLVVLLEPVQVVVHAGLGGGQGGVPVLVAAGLGLALHGVVEGGDHQQGEHDHDHHDRDHGHALLAVASAHGHSSEAEAATLGRNTRLVSTVAGTSVPDRDGRSTETVTTTLVIAVRLVVTASALSR